MKRSRKISRKLAARRKQWQHIGFYSLLGVAIIAVRLLFPEVVDLAFNEVQTLTQQIVAITKDGTTAILTIAGLVYAWKSLSKS